MHATVQYRRCVPSKPLRSRYSSPGFNSSTFIRTMCALALVTLGLRTPRLCPVSIATKCPRAHRRTVTVSQPQPVVALSAGHRTMHLQGRGGAASSGEPRQVPVPTSHQREACALRARRGVTQAKQSSMDRSVQCYSMCTVTTLPPQLGALTAEIKGRQALYHCYDNSRLWQERVQSSAIEAVKLRDWLVLPIGCAKCQRLAQHERLQVAAS